jgi:hypothetical protein
MPASVTVEAKSRLVIVRAWGVLLMEELVEAQRQIARAPGFEPHFRQLLDFEDVQETRLTPAGLQAMAATTPFHRDSPREILAKSDALPGFFRMYGVFSGSDYTRWVIFHRRDDAMAWAGSFSSH